MHRVSFESAFLNLNILPNESVMLKSLSGSRLGVWVAHAEGQFILPDPLGSYQAPARFSYPGYPGNPNGSPGILRHSVPRMAVIWS